MSNRREHRVPVTRGSSVDERAERLIRAQDAPVPERPIHLGSVRSADHGAANGRLVAAVKRSSSVTKSTPRRASTAAIAGPSRHRLAALPLIRRHGHDHDPAAVARSEVAAEGAVQVVADLPRTSGRLHRARRGRSRRGPQGHVRERKTDQRALARASPMTLRRNHPQRGLLARRIPARETRVYRLRCPPGRSSGVTHAGCTV